MDRSQECFQGQTSRSRGRRILRFLECFLREGQKEQLGALRTWGFLEAQNLGLYPGGQKLLSLTPVFSRP